MTDIGLQLNPTCPTCGTKLHRCCHRDCFDPNEGTCGMVIRSGEWTRLRACVVPVGRNGLDPSRNGHVPIGQPESEPRVQVGRPVE